MKNSLTFLEKRKQFLKMMAVRHGLLRPGTIDFTSGITIEEIRSLFSEEFAVSDVFSAGMTAAATARTSVKLEASMAIAFSESAASRATEAVAFCPVTFEFNAVTEKAELKAPVSVKLGVNDITIALVGEARVETLRAEEFGVDAELGALAITATMRALSCELMSADLEGTVSITGVVQEYDAVDLQALFEGSFGISTEVKSAELERAPVTSVDGAFEAEVQAQAADLVSIGLAMPFDLGITASLIARRPALVKDYYGKKVKELTGTVSSLSTIII